VERDRRPVAGPGDGLDAPDAEGAHLVEEALVEAPPSATTRFGSVATMWM
jgi:hypothetical protein